MMIPLLILAVCFLAYSNGANDNFKGVASLFGSKTASYRTALGWATITTFSGSLCAIFLAQSLLKTFSGKGLVPDEIISSPSFLFAVALGAGITVILATLTGFPVSTTHSLTGAMVGSGLVAVGTQVDFGTLQKSFLLPLVLSPVIAVVLAATLYLLFRLIRLRLGITKEWCVCIGEGRQVLPISQPASVMELQGTPGLELAVDEEAACFERYSGTYLGMNCQKAVDAAHFLSAGLVSFARGLNDTPKIAALLLLIDALDIRLGLIGVAVAIATGGLLNARKVAETMSLKITSLNHGQGFVANLSTGLLVVLASKYGLPVSTTHVSVGSLFGIGLTTRKANLRVVLGILLAWVTTLPCAALLAGLIFWLTTQL